MSSTTALPTDATPGRNSVSDDELDVITRRVVSDLHVPRAAVFWTDLIASAAIGWAAFVVAVAATPWSALMLAAVVVSGLALYRGLCFTHELTHLRRGSVPCFETVWNLLFGVPLLLPSFTYIGVHQSHHSLSTYGTKEDPEYLPFARSRRLILTFSVQASVLTPLALVARFLLLAPIGLIWPRFHLFLETYASSFSMNPAYRRTMTPAAAAKMRRWEAAVLVFWAGAIALIVAAVLPARTPLVWYGVLAFVSLLNTARVLGAHEYDSEGAPLSRHDQLSDSIDTPGRFWTELWAPVGLRYHALHHYFPGIPYHNLGTAYRRILQALPGDSRYQRSTSPSLWASLKTLYRKAGAMVMGRDAALPMGDAFRDR